MKKYENNVKSIYDKQTKTWFEVTTEQYAEFDRWRTNLRKREQYHHRCKCPRNSWWLCDGMCQDCEFNTPGDTISLDMPINNENGDETNLLDVIEDASPSIESILCDKDELDKLFEQLNKLIPEAIEIGKLRLDGFSDEEIAKSIGIKRTTFLSRLKKIKEQLSHKHPDLF